MRVIKRKKGKKEYFYLQHSIRKKNKVVTKEKYLGTDIPKNISEIISNFTRKIEPNQYSVLEKIRKSFQTEWRKLPDSVKAKHKEEISIAFTYNTNAIEGSKITLSETRGILHDHISPNKPIRDVKETEAHNKVFLEMLEKREALTTRTFLEWHKEIFAETKPDIAGKFRTYLVTIAGHIPPDWRKINSLVKTLLLFIKRSNKKINPVELSARVHYRFEKIHPFGDGNGRIGRLLVNYILWHNNYPMLIIENKKKAAYYKALKKDENGFVRYFMRRYLKAHKKLADR